MNYILLFKKKLLLLTFFVLLLNCIQAQVASKIDSLKNNSTHITNTETQVKIYFEIADAYMDVDQYDSTQVWLNKISEAIPIQQPSINSYFLSSRQAEVFYYNGLLRLGLQESFKSLKIATALNDSLLLADAYNFIGLFYINLDSCSIALPYLKKGISYVKQPPYPKQYLSLTLPHHLYGNLAEGYTKLGVYDSAIFYSNTSLKLAKQINWGRGVAVAQNNIAYNYLKQSIFDSAIIYFKNSIVSAQQSEDLDVEMLNYGGLASTYQLLNKKK